MGCGSLRLHSFMATHFFPQSFQDLKFAGPQLSLGKTGTAHPRAVGSDEPDRLIAFELQEFSDHVESKRLKRHTVPRPLDLVLVKACTGLR